MDRQQTITRRLYLRVLDGNATARTAIRVMCYECMGWQRREVARCTATACPLWQFRPGRDKPANVVANEPVGAQDARKGRGGTSGPSGAPEASEGREVPA